MNINLTLIGQSLAFGAFVWFCMKFVWPPIVGALEERKKKIADGLAAAERGHHEKDMAEQRASEILKEAKKQASEVLSHAEKRGGEIVEAAKSTAREEGLRITTAAETEIQQQVNRAREELRKQVGSIALLGAERVLKTEIDAKAHDKIIDELVAQI